MARSVGNLAATGLLLAALMSGALAMGGEISGRRLLAPSVWPPAAKCNRDPGSSPLRLEAAPPTVEGAFYKFCFKVLDNGVCDASEACCNKTLGVHKVAFQVDAKCKSSVKKVTIDGIADPGYEFNINDGTLRITDIDSPTVGQSICIYVKQDGVCTTSSQLFPTCTYSVFTADCDCCPVRQFCGPPSVIPSIPQDFMPPPPPPSSFPNCNCIKDNSITQYTVSQAAVITPNVAPGISKACFNINTKAACVPGGNTCCNFDLHKIEVNAPSRCASAIAYATVGSKKVTKAFKTKPYPAIKVSAIGIPFSSVNNTEVCLYLSAPCATLSDICPGGFCEVAVYNSNPKVHCCPVLPVAY